MKEKNTYKEKYVYTYPIRKCNINSLISGQWYFIINTDLKERLTLESKYQVFQKYVLNILWEKKVNAKFDLYPISPLLLLTTLSLWKYRVTICNRRG